MYSKKHISTMQDVNEFIDYCVDYIGIGFHPDTDFSDYIDLRSNETLFNKRSANQFNRLLSEAFNTCDKNGVDLYELTANKL